MARRKYGKSVYFGGRLDARVVNAFQNLCTDLGISSVKAFERLMIDAINAKEIPGVIRLEVGINDEPAAPLADRHQREKELDERISSEQNTFAEGSILHDSSNKE